jgi:thiamine biosynthesis lipoprotein
MGVRVERIMGTVVSIDVRDPDPEGPRIRDAVAAAVAWLRSVEARFSPYREDSEIRRLDRGDLAIDDCHPDVRHVLRVCEDLRRASAGAFDVCGHRPDGSLDPSGYVKGWAIDEAADLLAGAGIRSFAINAGGDVATRGAPRLGCPWRVGIRDPADASRVVAVLHLEDGAVATSGLYERGGHIRDPRSGSVPGAFASVTVVGPSLGLADACATAAFAMGAEGPAWVAGRRGFGILAVDHAGVATWSPVVDRALASPARRTPGSGTFQDERVQPGGPHPSAARSRS